MPTIKLDYTNTVIQDTYVDSVRSSSNLSADSGFVAGLATDKTALIKPTLGLIPNNAIINSAVLSVTASQTGTVQLEARKITSNWESSTVNWNTKPTIDSTILSSATSFNSANKVDFDVKVAIQDMVNGVGYGVALNGVGNSLSLYSTETTSTSYRPTLTIDYTIPTTDKKQVEFIAKDSAFGSSVPSLDIPIPSNKNVGDVLVAYIQCGGNVSSLISVPDGWTALSINENINSGSYFMSIIYKISDGTETVFQVKPGAISSINGSVHVYRNVKAIYNHGPLRYSSNNSQQWPNPPTDLKPNRLLINIVATQTAIIGYIPLSFSKENDAQGGGINNIISHSYNYSKTTYTTSELLTTLGGAYGAGAKLISLEPITNEAPKIDGSDGDLGALSAPLIKPYNVTDTESDTITITEKLNGKTVRTFTGSGTQTLNLSSLWASLPVGKHTVSVEANDDYANPPHTPTIRTWTFLKILPDTATLTESVQGLQQVVPYLQSQKAILASAIRAKGVVVNDTDRLENMAKALNSTDIPKTASGSIMSESTSTSFTNATGGATSANYIKFDMSLLPFVPSQITFKTASKTYASIVTWCKDDFYVNGTEYGNSTYLANTFRAPFVNGVVNVPVQVTNTLYTWVAYK